VRGAVEFEPSGPEPVRRRADASARGHEAVARALEAPRGLPDGAVARAAVALELGDALVRGAHPGLRPLLALAHDRDAPAEAGGLGRLECDRVERRRDDEGQRDRDEASRHANGGVRAA
jgi:hypothetical protein